MKKRKLQQKMASEKLIEANYNFLEVLVIDAFPEIPFTLILKLSKISASRSKRLCCNIWTLSISSNRKEHFNTEFQV